MQSGDSPQPDLTGIARLAAESDLLESKKAVRYFETDTQSALHRVRSGMPFTYSLNPYATSSGTRSTPSATLRPASPANWAK